MGEKCATETGKQNRIIKEKFDLAKFKTALAKRQQGKTSFEQFMDAIADAGILDYIVDHVEGKAVYRGLHNVHVEIIPL